MDIKEMRLRILEAIVPYSTCGINCEDKIRVARTYEKYILSSLSTDKVDTPVDNLKEGRSGSSVSTKSKPR